MNAPKLAGAPSVSASVAGTVPPAPPGASTFQSKVLDLTADMLPLKSCAIHFRVVLTGNESVGGSMRARCGFHSVEAVVGVEPSVV